MSDSFDTQVAIVGGGPAGAALHMRLAAAGIDCVLFERTPEPRWRACGVFSSPLARLRLGDLGLANSSLDELARPITALNVKTESGSACRLEYVTAAGPACGFDRVALDTLLLERARAAGGVVRTSAVVSSIVLARNRRETARLTVSPTGSGDGNTEVWRARLVVGADGPRSIVARTAGVARAPRILRKAGITFHQADVGEALPDSRLAEGHFVLGRGWYVGLAPVPGNRVNFGIVVPAKELRRPLERVVERVLGSVRSAGVPVGTARTDQVVVALPLDHGVTRKSGPGFVLVGDSSGFIDPLTGEGLHRALVSSQMASAAIVRWSSGDSQALGDYDRRLRSRFRNKDVVSWILQAFLAQPALLDYAVRRLETRDRQREVFTLVLTDQLPASRGLDPRFLGRLLAP